MLLSLLLATAVPAPPACPIERARYRLHGAPTFTAGFASQDRRNAAVSDLAFWVRTPARTYWFQFQAPNGHGGQSFPRRPCRRRRDGGGRGDADGAVRAGALLAGMTVGAAPAKSPPWPTATPPCCSRARNSPSPSRSISSSRPSPSASPPTWPSW